ncbi:hypothetical protein M0802_001631 [Mischocyttarus mexicanus]|nr:hypothetical protein M0802_001631 [Mischocyttarus mexicanus]
MNTSSLNTWLLSIWNHPCFNFQHLYPKHEHLLYPFLFAFILYAIKYTLNRYLFEFLAKTLNISNIRPKTAHPVAALEHAYIANQLNSLKMIAKLAHQIDWSENRIIKWYKIRRHQEDVSPFEKFCDSCWKCIYYTYQFIYGLILLWNKSWVLNTREYYYNYQYHVLTLDLWSYYMISIGFYWLSIYTHFYKMKRKGYWLVFFHNIVSLLLLHVTWVLNLIRIGSIILFIQCPAKSIRETVKMAKYSKYKKCNRLSFLFKIFWTVTYICFLPFFIIINTWFMLHTVMEITLLGHSMILLSTILIFLDNQWTKIFKELTLKLKSLSSTKVESPISTVTSDEDSDEI